MTSETPLPLSCPLCGRPNQCAMELPQGDLPAQPCWCTTMAFTQELLKRIPEALRGKACVCRDCASLAQPD